jgi:trigger factor
VKSAVETLNPTRVRLTVEVPFDELKPSLDAAYKKIAQQVNVPGFRKGRVPARIIDQRFGRGVVLEEAVNEALPRFYSQAVKENEVQVLGQPEVEITEFNDGQEFKFTVDVDVRPEIELPEYNGLEVTVDDVEVTDADIDEHLQNLRERFAVLTGVDRPVENRDYVSLDLAASVDGKVLEDGTATGMSYEVGSGDLLEGLDEAILGRSAGEESTFTANLRGGSHEDQDASIAVTVKSVKVKELPELDDEFAQTASEFDTIAELREDVRTRLERMKKMEQGVQARDKVLEALLAKVDVPVPEGVLKNEIEWREESLGHQLSAAGLTREKYLEAEGKSAEDFQNEIETSAADSIKAQFVLDAVATKEQLSVSEGELSEHIVRRASSSGVSPDQFAQQIIQGGQVPTLVSEVVRGKALALVLESAKVTDASGRTVDLEALREDELAVDAEEAGEIAGQQAVADPEAATVAQGTDDETTGPAADQAADQGAAAPEKSG